MLNRLYPLRKCENLKKEVCLYYHIGECLGYCKKDFDLDKVNQMTSEITSFLKGNKEVVTKKIKEDMEKASNNLNFEKALELKTMLDDIEITLRHQKIDLNKNYNFDLFNFYQEENYLSIQIFYIREGLLFGKHSEIVNSMGDSSDELIEYIIKFYEKNPLLPKELVVPQEIDKDLLSKYFNIKVSTYQKGDVKKLLDLARDNAKVSLDEKLENIKRSDKDRLDAQEELRILLGLDKLSRIEAFDNSHLFGTYYVGGMVVFDDFLPNKNEYRKFKIQSDIKDDLSAMKEVIYRRYFRVLMDNLVLPDLILVDGGELQVSVVKEVIDSLNLDIAIVGLKKNEHHRTSTLINSNLEEISIKKDSSLFVFLSKIQEEVHRYAITYHRNIKSKGSLSSILDMVDGVGPARKKELLKKFGSLKKMREASIEELETILPGAVAKNLFDYLKNIDN